MDDGAWKRVGVRVRSRREELGLTQERFAAQASVGTATVRLIESAGRETYNRSTIVNVARALGWTPDSIDRILKGGEPEEAPESEKSAEERLAELEARVAALEASGDR
jgi:transcriptional regulator with XRE-family HTH domain